MNAREKRIKRHFERLFREAGLENVWCEEHDRPPLALVDPMTLGNMKREGWHDYPYHLMCSRVIELPILKFCWWRRKQEGDGR